MKKNTTAELVKNVALNLAIKANGNVSLFFLVQPKIDKVLHKQIKELEKRKSTKGKI